MLTFLVGHSWWDFREYGDLRHFLLAFGPSQMLLPLSFGFQNLDPFVDSVSARACDEVIWCDVRVLPDLELLAVREGYPGSPNRTFLVVTWVCVPSVSAGLM